MNCPYSGSQSTQSHAWFVFSQRLTVEFVTRNSSNESCTFSWFCTSLFLSSFLSGYSKFFWQVKITIRLITRRAKNCSECWSLRAGFCSWCTLSMHEFPSMRWSPERQGPPLWCSAWHHLHCGSTMDASARRTSRPTSLKPEEEVQHWSDQHSSLATTTTAIYRYTFQPTGCKQNIFVAKIDFFLLFEYSNIHNLISVLTFYKQKIKLQDFFLAIIFKYSHQVVLLKSWL